MPPITRLAPLLFLAGCATGVPVERQVVVSGAQFAAVAGEAELSVRAFLPAEDGTRGEVVGASCDVVSSLYATKLVTPSRLVVPNFGPQSPELVATCHAGELTGTGRTRIVTRWQQPPWGWGPGPGLYPYPVGPAWGWGWYQPSYPISDYPNLIVTMH